MHYAQLVNAHSQNKVNFVKVLYNSPAPHGDERKITQLYTFHQKRIHRRYTKLFLVHSQSGIIYTENMPRRRLCKMCNLFFYEFHVILSANVFHHVCYTATIYSLQRMWTRGLILIDVLLTLAGGQGLGAMLYFSDGSLPGYFAGVGTAELQVSANSRGC
jgi:hypothetical protein